MSGATADMARRNTRFDASQQPVTHEPDLQIQSEKTTGPISSLNPTRARFTLMRTATQPKDIESDDDGDSKGSEGGATPGGTEVKVPSNVEYKYSNRDNRKGRHNLVVRSATSKDEQPFTTPPSTSSFHHVLGGI